MDINLRSKKVHFGNEYRTLSLVSSDEPYKCISSLLLEQKYVKQLFGKGR